MMMTHLDLLSQPGTGLELNATTVLCILVGHNTASMSKSFEHTVVNFLRRSHRSHRTSQGSPAALRTYRIVSRRLVRSTKNAHQYDFW